MSICDYAELDGDAVSVSSIDDRANQPCTTQCFEYQHNDDESSCIIAFLSRTLARSGIHTRAAKIKHIVIVADMIFLQELRIWRASYNGMTCMNLSKSSNLARAGYEALLS